MTGFWIYRWRLRGGNSEEATLANFYSMHEHWLGWGFCPMPTSQYNKDTLPSKRTEVPIWPNLRR